MLKDLPHRRGRRYILDLIEQGEHQQQDFKYSVSDACKIARSISAFSNAEGGRLLIGVKDNGTVAGVRNEEDIYVVEQAATLYCRPSVDVSFKAYTCDTNVVIIEATVPRSHARPVVCREAEGGWRAYYRVADENIVAHPLMVKAWQTSSAEFSLTAQVTNVIETLKANREGLDIDQLARLTNSSIRSTEQTVVSLVAAGVATFIYRAPRFRIALAEPLPPTID